MENYFIEDGWVYIRRHIQGWIKKLSGFATVRKAFYLLFIILDSSISKVDKYFFNV